MKFPNRETVERVRREYPAGTRVELVRMDDAQAPPIGTRGTVEGVDDTASIMVRWDNGSRLHVVYGEDACRKLSDDREVTVEELLRRCLTSGKAFHFMTPAGYVGLTARDAEKILAGEMNPEGHPGSPEFAVEMEVRELLEFRCQETDVQERQGVVSALVY